MPPSCRNYWRCPCSHCWKRNSVYAQRDVNVRIMSQQPNYGQQSMSENSWDLVNKAAVASAAAAVNAYNGYGASTPVTGYHRSSSNSSNGSHLQASPTAAAAGNSTQPWHGVRLPTAPSSSSSSSSSSSGNAATVADQWLAATNHLQQQHQSMSGMSLIAPSSASAAAQLYSGNTTSYYATGGGDPGLNRPSLLPPPRPPPPPPPPPASAAVLSPTSPMISPSAAWPPQSRQDSILAKQHHHQFHLPQQNHQQPPPPSEQRSPQHPLVHGLQEKTAPTHFHQQHHAHHQQYPGAAAYAANASATSYEKLLEAVAIQAARAPFLNQQTPASSSSHQQQQQQPPTHYHLEQGVASDHKHAAVGGHHSSLLELDILRNLAATAGSATGGHNVSAQHGQLLPQAPQQSGTTFGSNGYGGSSFRPPIATTIKQEPSFCDVTPPPAPIVVVATNSTAMPTADLDVAHTMLSIQTCSIQNTVPEYQQISPAPESSQSEMKYRPPSLTAAPAAPAVGVGVGLNSTTTSQKHRRSSGSGNGDDENAFSAITVEGDNDDPMSSRSSSKRLKICTTPDNNGDDDSVEMTTMKGEIAEGNHHHSDVIAQKAQAKNNNDNNDDDDDDQDSNYGLDENTLLRGSISPTMLSDNAKDGAENEASPVVSQSSPSNDTPLSVGGRTGSIGSHCSPSSNSGNGSPTDNNGHGHGHGHVNTSGLGSATATATAVSYGNASLVLPGAASDALPVFTSSSNLAGTSSTVTHPPGLVGPSPFGVYTAQHANHANLHTCHICGFTSPSKFHFNSHMNTHADHKCDFCDYTSRTEGRLKRHMKEFHSPRMSPGNSNDADSSHGMFQSGGSAQFDQSLEEQLQAVVASMTSGGGSAGGGGVGYNLSPTPPSSSKAGGSGGGGGGSKSKTYRCKQCEFVAKSKDDYWAHSRAHIKTDKLLTCPKCPFVTEYKHHLEYHLRNHFGSKPFKCVKCNYSCVNKSMLNSHMKSHSNFYQYRCSDCTYATKYCHSLKLHLRKYAHTPATTVTADGGTVVDGSAIDVYGNRRGPRGKKGSDNGSRSSGEGPRSMVSTSGGPISASLPIASPSHSHLQHHQGGGNGSGPSGFVTAPGLMPPMTLSETLNHHHSSPSGVVVSSSGPLMPMFVEALQSSLLQQQQKDLTAAMVTSIATLGAQLPTIPSLAAALAAAQNNQQQQSPESSSQQRADSVSPAPATTRVGCQTPSSAASTSNNNNNFRNLTSPASANLRSSPMTSTSTTNASNSNQSMKCNLCDFACSNKETLTKHTMIHVMEKPEHMYQVYSFMAQAQAQAVAAAAAALATNSQQSTSGSSSCGSTPVIGEHGTKEKSSSSMNFYGGASSTLDEQSGGGRFDTSQDSGGSPASVSGGKTSGDEAVGNETFFNVSSTNSATGHRQRRKGRAFKLDRISLKLQGKNCDDGDTDGGGSGGDYENTTNVDNNVANANRTIVVGARHTRSTSPATGCQSATGHRVNRSESVSSVSGIGRPILQHGLGVSSTTSSTAAIDSHSQSQTPTNQTSSQQQSQARHQSSLEGYPSPLGRPTNIDWSNAYVCNYCEIAFKDCIMYTMHMGFHGYQDPYKCNTCGHVSDDPRSMFLHIAREPHL